MNIKNNIFTTLLNTNTEDNIELSNSNLEIQPLNDIVGNSEYIKLSLYEIGRASCSERVCQYV